LKLKGLSFRLIIIAIVLLSLFLFACHHKHLKSIHPNPIVSVSKISGVVYGDSIRAPVQALVLLRLHSIDVARIQSNSNGEFEITNLTPGEYGLIVLGPKKFETAEFSVKAAPDSETVVSMQLHPSGGSLGFEPWLPTRIPLNLKIDILPMSRPDSLQDKQIK